MTPKKIGSFYFNHAYQVLPFPSSKLKNTIALLEKKEKKGIAKKTVEVTLCSDYLIKKLNSRYRGINRATDVLSFSFSSVDILGEIYISLQRAAIQARKYNVTYTDEVNRLFVHGFFHLLGFDHETEKDQAQMVVRELRYI